MAKTFSIIKKENLITNEVDVENFTWKEPDEKRKRLLDKLARKENTNIFRYFYDEDLYMHLLPDMSEELVEELSSHIFSYAYAVIKKKGKKERVLYLSLFKGEALKFKNAIPASTIWVNHRKYLNPDYYVKELRIVF